MQDRLRQTRLFGIEHCSSRLSVIRFRGNGRREQEDLGREAKGQAGGDQREERGVVGRGEVSEAVEVVGEEDAVLELVEDVQHCAVDRGSEDAGEGLEGRVVEEEAVRDGAQGWRGLVEGGDGAQEAEGDVGC